MVMVPEPSCWASGLIGPGRTADATRNLSNFQMYINSLTKSSVRYISSSSAYKLVSEDRGYSVFFVNLQQPVFLNLPVTWHSLQKLSLPGTVWKSSTSCPKAPASPRARLPRGRVTVSKEEQNLRGKSATSLRFPRIVTWAAKLCDRVDGGICGREITSSCRRARRASNNGSRPSSGLVVLTTQYRTDPERPPGISRGGRAMILGIIGFLRPEGAIAVLRGFRVTVQAGMRRGSGDAGSGPPRCFSRACRSLSSLDETRTVYAVIPKWAAGNHDAARLSDAGGDLKFYSSECKSHVELSNCPEIRFFFAPTTRSPPVLNHSDLASSKINRLCGGRLPVAVGHRALLLQTFDAGSGRRLVAKIPSAHLRISPAPGMNTGSHVGGPHEGGVPGGGDETQSSSRDQAELKRFAARGLSTAGPPQPWRTLGSRQQRRQQNEINIAADGRIYEVCGDVGEGRLNSGSATEHSSAGKVFPHVHPGSQWRNLSPSVGPCRPNEPPNCSVNSTSPPSMGRTNRQQGSTPETLLWQYRARKRQQIALTLGEGGEKRSGEHARVDLINCSLIRAAAPALCVRGWGSQNHPAERKRVYSRNLRANLESGGSPSTPRVKHYLSGDLPRLANSLHAAAQMDETSSDMRHSAGASCVARAAAELESCSKGSLSLCVTRSPLPNDFGLSSSKKPLLESPDKNLSPFAHTRYFTRTTSPRGSVVPVVTLMYNLASGEVKVYAIASTRWWWWWWWGRYDGDHAGGEEWTFFAIACSVPGGGSARFPTQASMREICDDKTINGRANELGAPSKQIKEILSAILDRPTTDDGTTVIKL
ncbi:hypothetical protein BKA62DRAFT_672173 [Auriculariales sp. MPI-PUGE-AT-0066]|nr:hypothetical protein BKA62DRAFT_672173 [Auriculariales sp. MPI-PUGE-AT-0066]